MSQSSMISAKTNDRVMLQLARCLPSSLAFTNRCQITFGPGGMWAREYCLSCGNPMGKVLLENLLFISSVCDNCERLYGGIPWPEIPQDTVKQIVREE
jgi:hypothetical protein